MGIICLGEMQYINGKFFMLDNWVSVALEVKCYYGYNIALNSTNILLHALCLKIPAC